MSRTEELKGSGCLWGGKSQRAALPSIQLLRGGFRVKESSVLETLVCRKYQSTSHMVGCSNKPEEENIQQEEEEEEA